MQNPNLKIFIIFLFLFFFKTVSYSEIIKKIEIYGNNRISEDTIKMFSEININENLEEKRIDNILKNIYQSNFFDKVYIKFENQILKITVKELPIIFEIKYDGVKSNDLLNKIITNNKLKPRSSFNKNFVDDDINTMISNLRNLGYFFAKIDSFQENIGNNQVNLRYSIDIGSKAKIKRISFIGNKIFKDRKLRNVIISEEYKFWKFLSGKKYLNLEIINLDERLLKNLYLNNGFYNVKINSSFAKSDNNNDFELIYNIDAGEKIYFGELNLELPIDFDQNNFLSIQEIFKETSETLYSVNKIEKILNEIDKIVLNKQYQSISSSVNENLVGNKLDLKFSILENEKIFISKINIFGNNVTEESVIRNQFLVDEGDPFNDILISKSINNIKALNFFKDVQKEILTDENNETKTINITVTEKPTGEISAGAGFGTSGSTLMFGVKENNFLGRGISLDSNLSLSTDSIKGQFIVENDNYKNSDKAVYFSILANEIDRLKESGYKTNRAGFSLGTKFEYYDDFFLNLGTSTFYEVLDTDSTASERQKLQAGNYFDQFIKIDFDYDKRNQKFQTSDGFRSYYSLDIPLISETYTLTNSYDYKYFTELYENNISSFSLSLKNTFSLNNKDVKLSERLYIPSRMLRGFETGKVGPKDGEDFVGGNFLTAANFSTNLPFFLENVQNTDFLLFVDIANLWGVDYDSSLDDNNIKSSIGIAVDWFTPVGPLNFSLAQPITKGPNDIEESFRFNLGTTF